MAKFEDSQIALKAERAYVHLIGRHGTSRAGARTLNIQPDFSGDGVTDCWTHAWKVAKETGGRYVEGTCRRTMSRDRIATHAWVEKDTPFGVQIIETTEGYEQASDYRGLVIDTRPGSLASRLTSNWPKDGQRSSIIQAALAGGWSPDMVLELVVAK